MDKEVVVSMYIRVCVCACVCVLFSHKKEIPSFATWVDPEGVTLSEISQRQIRHGTTYMWNLKERSQTLREQKKMVVRDWGWGK